MYTFTCIDVIDHGHCVTALFETADKNSRMHLYIYAGDPTPKVGDFIRMAPCEAPVHGGDYTADSAPVNLPTDPPVPADPLPAVFEHVPGQEGEAATDDQNAGGDVQAGEEQGHSVDIRTSGNDAGTIVPLAQVDELLSASVGAVDGVAPLSMVADTEVHEESAEPASLGVAPLCIDAAQEPVDLGDLQVNLSTVDAVALSDGEVRLAPEVLGGTTGQ